MRLDGLSSVMGNRNKRRVYVHEIENEPPARSANLVLSSSCHSFWFVVAGPGTNEIDRSG